MKIKILLFYFVLASGIFISNPSSAQQFFESINESETLIADTTKKEIEVFPVSEIVSSINETFNIVNKSLESQLSDEEISQLVAIVDTLVTETNQFLNDSLTNNLERISLRELDGLIFRTRYLSSNLNQYLDELMSRTNDINQQLSDLSYNERRWRLTLENLPEKERSETIISRMQKTVNLVDSVGTILQNDFEILFNNQTRLSDEIASLEILSNKLSEKERNINKILFRVDMPVFFKDFSSLSEPDLLNTHFDKIKSNFREDFKLFADRYLHGVIVILIIFVFVFLLARWSKNYYFIKDPETFSKFSRFGKVLIDSPFFTTLFLATLSIRLIFPELPQMVRVINLLFLMIPVIYFVIRMYYRYVRSIVNFLVLIYIFTFLYELIFFPDIILRIVLLGFSISGLIFFSAVIKIKPLKKAITNKLVYGLWRMLIFVFILFQIIGIVGNLIGAFSMAEFFTYAPIHTLILGITVFVTTKVAETLIPIILKSDMLQELNVIREDFESIRKITTRWIKIFMWLLFIFLAFRFFRIQEPILEWFDNLLNNGWEIGAVEITLMSVIIFIFIIWLSIMLSRIITQILEKDIFERIKVSRGVPATVTMVLKIIFIAGGFLLAAAAAGMELTNLSIILGAFSVGIGFGLQNIFNNLVSGLIIAFERPIKVGDTVQVDQLLGTVKKIGLRSSTVKSFDGAEVIVPNGNIISNQMINWTLSDFSRRMDIRIGVAYGTDPEKVLEIMMKIAEEHEKVYKVPKPHAYFIGFGDSSLDFRLLAWSNIENRLVTESEIHVQINKKLAEAKIEIPFPQRDLHIRSDDTIKKGAAPAKTTKSTRRKNSDNK